MWRRPPIDKHTLLHLLNGAFGAGVTITPRDEPRIDRSLDSDALPRGHGLRAARLGGDDRGDGGRSHAVRGAGVSSTRRR